MGKMSYATFVRVVAGSFCISAMTAFGFTVTRLLKPDRFYTDELVGTEKALHLFLCGLMMMTSAIGFINSCVVVVRAPGTHTSRQITAWLLLESLFETARVLQLFISEVLICSSGPLQKYDTILGGVQYLVDSLLYCQVILKKQ